MSVKQTIRRFFNMLHLDVTKNLAYDRLTKVILKKTLKQSSNCIDVGAHKGEILDLILVHAPAGQHYAFEPIPLFYNKLKEKYTKNVTVLSYALSEKSGVTSFNFVKNAPAYSGIKERKYQTETPNNEKIEVELKPLDEVISPEVKIDFIKIDVEGGEFDVLRGAKRILTNDQPILLFESGLGASEYYGTTPKSLYDFFKELDYKVFTLKSFAKNGKPLTPTAFKTIYETNAEYYFVASRC